MNDKTIKPWNQGIVLAVFFGIVVFLVWGFWGGMPQPIWAMGLIVAAHFIVIFVYRTFEEHEKGIDLTLMLVTLWIGIFVGLCSTWPADSRW